MYVDSSQFQCERFEKRLCPIEKRCPYDSRSRKVSMDAVDAAIDADVDLSYEEVVFSQPDCVFRRGLHFGRRDAVHVMGAAEEQVQECNEGRLANLFLILVKKIARAFGA